MKNSWLYLDEEMAHLWDQFTDQKAVLTNTHLLMRLAAKPFFTFFFDDLMTIIPADEASLNSVQDPDYQRVLLSKKQEMLRAYRTLVQDSLKESENSILLSTRDFALPPEFRRIAQKVSVYDREPFGNVEGIWRKIRIELNKKSFTQIYVLGDIERAWIIPRLAEVYNVPVYDVSHAGTPRRQNKLVHLAKKVARRILRKK